MKSFRSQMEDWMCRYKVDRIHIQEHGKWRGRQYPHILPQDLWFFNLWEGICFKTVKYLD